jgi:hypothetical protein
MVDLCDFLRRRLDRGDCPARIGELWYNPINSLKLDNWFCVVQPPPTLLWADGIFMPAVPEKAVQMDVRLYVGNLAKSTTEEELKTLFSQAGAVSAVDLVKDRDNGQSKGFAFITMGEQTEADKAITMFNAYKLAEHELKVNVAKPKVERAK